jgi:hypothetical protein
MKLRVIVPREWESDFAVVECEQTAWINNAKTLKDAITAAVNDWQATEAGRAALKRSGGDFNIGDLHCELGNAELDAFLAKHGVLGLKIETFGADSLHGWAYDDHLFDELTD